MKLLLLLSAVVLCHGTDPARHAHKDFCQMGCVNGYCIADHGTFKCSCIDNWFGDNCTQHICDKVLEGGENPLCQNGGTCVIKPNNISDFLCSCPLGYTGRNCQYRTHGDACSFNSCSGNGICYNLASGGYECVCHPGAYGPNCNISSNALCFANGVRNCHGNGVCEMIYIDGNLFPNCTCFPEYEPTTKCQYLAAYNVCEYERPCMNGGICSHVTAYTYECECPPDKTGVNCTEEFDGCEPSPCEGNGTCGPAFGGHYYQCNCPDNRQGYNCEYVVDPCLGKCAKGEICVPLSRPESNGLYSPSADTECLRGYESHDHCNPSPCGAYGTCTSTDAGYECECQSGFTGQNCTKIDYCLTNPCSLAHSTHCLNHPVGTGVICVCSPGWGGDHCNQDINEFSEGCIIGIGIVGVILIIVCILSMVMIGGIIIRSCCRTKKKKINHFESDVFSLPKKEDEY